MIPLMAAAAAAALPTPVPVPATDHQIDYAGFERLTHEVRPEREKRRITLARFQAMAARDGAVILDARSAPAFAGGTSRARSTAAHRFHRRSARRRAARSHARHPDLL